MQQLFQAMIIQLVSLFLLPISVICLGTTQSAGVKGTLMCDNKPAKNVKVKLYDDDRGWLFW